MRDPSQPDHCLRCSGFVHASNNKCALRCNRHVNAISSSEGRSAFTSMFFPASMLPSSLCFKFFQVLVELIHPLFPRQAVSFQPLRGFPQRGALETTRSLLSIATATDQPCALQNLEVFGYRRWSNRKWL